MSSESLINGNLHQVQYAYDIKTTDTGTQQGTVAVISSEFQKKANDNFVYFFSLY